MGNFNEHTCKGRMTCTATLTLCERCHDREQRSDLQRCDQDQRRDVQERSPSPTAMHSPIVEKLPKCGLETGLLRSGRSMRLSEDLESGNWSSSSSPGKEREAAEAVVVVDLEEEEEVKGRWCSSSSLEDSNASSRSLIFSINQQKRKKVTNLLCRGSCC